MKSLQILAFVFILVCTIGLTCNRDSAGKQPLKEIFGKYFLVGAALNNDVVSGGDRKAAEIVKSHFNTVTAEDAMKWERIHPKLNKFNFGPADRFVEFGIKNKMFIIGHTLIWQSQIPDWAFTDEKGNLLGRDSMLARMKNHIDAVVGRYKGKVGGWDVVNEALSDEGMLQNTKWVQTIGEDYVAKAFEYAHRADPDAELYYNDYSLDKPQKRDAAVRLLKDLKSRGLRVDGIGIQGHWGMDYPTRENFDAFADSITEIGVNLMVTEMDLDILPVAWEYSGADINARSELRKELNPYPDGLPEEMQKVHADRYSELFRMLVDHADNITRVTFWGVYDKTSWLNNWPVRGRTSYPLLFDRNYQPKPAFDAIAKMAQAKK